MRALVVVEGHPFPDRRFRLRSGLPGMQVNALVFQGAPQPLDEDVVEETALPIHRYAHVRSAEPIGPDEGCELRSLVGVHDLGRPELVDGLIQRFDTEVSLQGVRYPPGQNLAGVPVHPSRAHALHAPAGQWIATR